MHWIYHLPNDLEYFLLVNLRDVSKEGPPYKPVAYIAHGALLLPIYKPNQLQTQRYKRSRYKQPGHCMLTSSSRQAMQPEHGFTHHQQFNIQFNIQ